METLKHIGTMLLVILFFPVVLFLLWLDDLDEGLKQKYEDTGL